MKVCAQLCIVFLCLTGDNQLGQVVVPENIVLIHAELCGPDLGAGDAAIAGK